MKNARPMHELYA